MKNPSLTLILFLVVPGHLSRSEIGFGVIQLLDSYLAKPGSTVDAAVWTIQGKNGLIVYSEAGPSESRAVALNDSDNYEWHREQTDAHVSGHVYRADSGSPLA